MKILVTPEDAGATPYCIAGGLDAGSGIELHSPNGFEIEHSLNEQVVELLRADEIRIFSRGNKRTVITFEAFNVPYDGTSPGDGIRKAETEMLDSGRYVCKALITIFCGLGQEAIRFMRGVVKVKPRIVAGATYTLSFTITGGKISTTVPPVYP